MWLSIVTFLCFNSIIATATRQKLLIKNASDTRPLIKSVGQGGSEGTAFDDLNSTMKTIVGVRSINFTIDYNRYLFQISYALAGGGQYATPIRKFGALNQIVTNITVAPDEYIQKIEGGTDGIYVNQLTFTVVKPSEYERRVFLPIGDGTGGYDFTFEGYIVGFYGFLGAVYWNQIGVYFLPPLQKKLAFTGQGGDSSFDENPDSFVPAAVKITKLLIHHGSSIDSIQVEYQLYGGGKRLGMKHGGNGGDLSIISLDPGEKIVGLDGKTGGNSIDQLTFTAERVDGTLVQYGPFGKLGDKPFSAHGNILGFYGRQGDLIIGIGIYFY